MNSFKIIIDGEDVTRFSIYPLNLQFTLDDALDQAYVELRNTPVTEAYPAFAKVEITVNDDKEPTIYYVGVDNCVVNQKTGRANHKILLTEETKILERVICRAKSFVKPMISDYLAHKIQANGFKFDTVKIFKNDKSFYADKMHPELGKEDDNPNYQFTTNPNAFIYAKPLSVPFQTGTRLSVTDVFGINISESITNYSWMLEIFENGVRAGWANQYRGGTLSGATLDFPRSGAFTLYAWIWIQTASTTHNCAAEYFVATASPVAAPKSLTITTVTNELLEIAEPIRANETPRFTLNEADAARYANTPCAELNFANGATLWENLLEIGKIIHCIPRLKNNVVYFDKLGSNEMLAANAFGTPISTASDSTSEKFASHLDSVVNGLMNLDNEEQGAMSDPFLGGFRTLRSEVSNTDMRTTVDTAIIRTVEPIEKITKVTVLYEGAEYDITPYVYEKKEYDLLYSNQGTYPYSKAYALYYVQGQPNIYGLQYKEDNAVSKIFEKFSIENILKTVTGKEVDLGSSDWQKLQNFLFGTDSSKFLQLAFNVTYVTTINGRVRQAKRNVDDIKTVSVMAFNQSANRLSSVNYGKRLKGEIAMMGSADVKLAFKTNNWEGIKTAVGKLYPHSIYGSNMYISNVTAKMWGGYFLVELGLTKNFNQLGRFVSVNSAVRQFEIDTNVSESYFVDEEYLVFSETEANNDDECMVNALTLENSVQDIIIGNTNANGSKITLADACTKDGALNNIQRVALPVQSVALGNSLLFNFKYEDNHSAGEKLTAVSDKGYKLTQLVPYGDPLYGEAKYLSVRLIGKMYQYNQLKLSQGDTFPLYPSNSFHEELILASSEFFGRYSKGSWIVNKSSRDALNITYQIHFVTDCGIIFGEQLMQANPLVGGKIAEVNKIQGVLAPGSGNPIINFYKGRVNEITGETDETPIHQAGLHHAVYPNEANMTRSHGNLTIYGDLPSSEYASWNVKDVNGRVLIAKNGPFAGLYYYTKRKIGG